MPVRGWYGNREFHIPFWSLIYVALKFTLPVLHTEFEFQYALYQHFHNFRVNKKKDITNKIFSSKTAFTRCRHILKTMKNVTEAKFELAFTRCRNNLKTVRNLSVKSSLQDFDAKEVYLNPKNCSVSIQKCRKMFCFHLC